MNENLLTAADTAVYVESESDGDSVTFLLTFAGGDGEGECIIQGSKDEILDVLTRARRAIRES